MPFGQRGRSSAVTGAALGPGAALVVAWPTLSPHRVDIGPQLVRQIGALREILHQSAALHMVMGTTDDHTAGSVYRERAWLS